MQFRLLGSLEAVVDGRPVELAPKVRALVAVLVLHRGEVVSADALADALWGEVPPSSWATMLHGYVSQLRSKLRPAAIATRSPGYLLAVEPEAVDAWSFEDLVSRGRTALGEGQPDEAAGLLRDALALWRGPALGEHAQAVFAHAEAARLEELRLVATEELIEAELALGHHAQQVGTLQSLVDAHPLRERLWGQLILALYRSERRADALRSYAELRRRLAEGLGIDPGPALRQLEEDVLLQRPRLAWQPAEPVSEEVPSNLPTSRSSFVGREQELGELDKLLAFGLVTMIGPGGVGKTRLAIEAAREVRFRYPDGAWLVELASLSEPALVPQAVARAMGVVEEPGRSLTDTLKDALAPKRTLLVLDNCEHMVEATASLVDALLDAAPNLALLATSREPLRVEGELLWDTPSLPVALIDDLPPEVLAGVDAVRLFCDRAASQGPFVLTTDNAADVSALCRGLDGIPLAIELAAARTGVLSPAHMLARLGDRLRFLSSGLRTVPRHETLRAAIEWSHDLLTEQERFLFRRLAVFAGFSLEAAEEVCSGDGLDRSDVAALLVDLVDRSLVVPEPVLSGSPRELSMDMVEAAFSCGDVVDEDVLGLVSALVAKSVSVATPRTAGNRYRLLETIGHYAGERLADTGEEATVRRRHLDFYLALAEATTPEAYGAAAGAALDRLEAEHENFRLALGSALDACSSDESRLRLAGRLSLLWRLRGHLGEGRRWLERVLAAAPNGSPGTRATALVALATLSYNQTEASDDGAADYAERLGREALALWCAIGADAEAAETLCLLGAVAQRQGRNEEARLLLEESLAMWQRSGQRQALGHYSLNATYEFLGNLAFIEGSYTEADLLYRRCLTVLRDLGDVANAAWPIIGLGACAKHRGELDTAETYLAAGVEMARATGYKRALGNALGWRTEVALERGNLAEAVRLGRDGLLLARELDNLPMTLAYLRLLAEAFVESGAPMLACRLLGAVDTAGGGGDKHTPVAAAVRAILDADSFTRGWSDGRAMTLEEAITATLEEQNEG